jgi:hypothetical protein
VCYDDKIKIGYINGDNISVEAFNGRRGIGWCTKKDNIKSVLREVPAKDLVIIDNGGKL